MFIYNITIKVDWEIHEEWLPWLFEYFVPVVMKTNCFEKSQSARLHEIDESEGPTYAVQFYAISKAQYNRFMEIYAQAIMQNAFHKWNGSMLSFSTLMEIIDE